MVGDKLKSNEIRTTLRAPRNVGQGLIIEVKQRRVDVGETTGRD
jgi:hypothetical protein